MPRTSVVEDIERTLTLEAKKIGVLFQQIDGTTLGVLVFLEKELGKSSRSYKQWASFTTSIRNVVQRVREISNEGQSYIDDVLSSFTDYMCLSRENSHLKAQEIQGYKANLDTLGKRTKEVVSDVFDVLKETQKEIGEFISHWPLGDSQFSKDVGPRIKEVQNNIKSIQSSIEQLRACQNRSSNCGDQPLSHYDSRIRVVLSLSLLLPQPKKGHLHAFLKGTNSPEVEEAQRGIDDQTFDSLDTLINVGQMLSSDITELQRQFNDYRRSHDLDVFKARFDSIRDLYICLPTVLREFNKACFMPEKKERGPMPKFTKEKKPSVFKKILRLFGMK